MTKFICRNKQFKSKKIWLLNKILRLEFWKQQEQNWNQKQIQSAKSFWIIEH